MLDFYEGEALRRTILIRNAMRRTEAITQEIQRRQQKYDRKKSNLSQSDTELFYGDMNSTTAEAEQVSPVRLSAPVRVQVTDYDYDIEAEQAQNLHNAITEDDEYEDATEDEDDDDDFSDEDDDAMRARHGHVIKDGVRVSVTSVVKDEHTWFDDLLDEVSIDESKPRSYIQRIHPSDQEKEEGEGQQDLSASISSIGSSVESLSINNDSMPTSASSASSLPSLMEDEDESSGCSSAEDDELEDAFSQHYTNRFGKAVNYSGGAELSATTKNHQPFMHPTETFLDW